MTKTLLVIGATGQQGGAVARALLAAGNTWRVAGLSRDPASKRAAALRALGVEVRQGDMRDRGSLAAAMRDVYGVFSVQGNTTGGAEHEVWQGRLVADAAAEVGVKHFVYSSVGGAERNSGVPHFESKWRIERHIRSLDLPATILRPATFMDNFKALPLRTVVLSMAKTFVPEEKALQLVAVQDIGAFAALAFENPQDYVGQAIELAGDALTHQQIADTLRANGVWPLVSLRLTPLLTSRLPEEFPLMFRWLAEHGMRADIPALRSRYAKLMTLGEWAKALRKRQ